LTQFGPASLPPRYPPLTPRLARTARRAFTVRFSTVCATRTGRIWKTAPCAKSMCVCMMHAQGAYPSPTTAYTGGGGGAQVMQRARANREAVPRPALFNCRGAEWTECRRSGPNARGPRWRAHACGLRTRAWAPEIPWHHCDQNKGRQICRRNEPRTSENEIRAAPPPSNSATGELLLHVFKIMFAQRVLRCYAVPRFELEH